MSTPLSKYDSINAAQFLLALANKKGFALNVTKVQKLLYIIYGDFLAKKNHVLLSESPKAWPYGPVFPRSREKVDYGIVYSGNEPELAELKRDEVTTEVMNRVIDKYAKFSAGQLSKWSHMEGSPWDRTTKLPNFKWGQPIPDDYIEEYFCSLNV